MQEQFWNDQWTTEIEHLGFQHAGDQLVKMILSAPLPFAIGVNGKWGSGKTSLMRYAMASLGGSLLEVSLPGQLEKEVELKEEEAWKEFFKPLSIMGMLRKSPKSRKILTEEAAKRLLEEMGNPFLSVWFNPWQYQQDPNPLIPLLHEIRTQTTSWLSQKQQDSAFKIAKTSIEAGLSLLGQLPALAGLPKLSVSSVREIGERLERENLDVLTDAQRFNLLFEKAVSLLLGKGTKKGGKRSDDEQAIEDARRLVIFIDDLDRCEDAQIRHLLEAIKLYLSTDNCLFVLGLDRSAAERAICRERKDKSEREASEYVEKLFQATVNVPLCRDYGPFIQNKLLGAGFTKEDLQGSVGLSKEDRVELKDLSVPDVLGQLLEPNPRKVKNFLNGLIIQWNIQEKDINTYLKNLGGKGSSTTKKDLLIQFSMIHYLRQYHPVVFRTLEQDLNLFPFFLEIISGEKPERKVPEQDLFYEEFEHVFKVAEYEVEGPDAKAHRRTMLRERKDILRGDRAFKALLLPVFDGLPKADDPSDLLAILFGSTVPKG